MTTTAAEMEKVEDQLPDHVEGGGHYAPQTDITESDDAFVFCAEMPGVKPGNVEATFADGVLTLRGRVEPRQAPGQRYALQEYGVADFRRSFSIDAPVAPDKITAVLRDGLLTVTVPKAESARRRKIAVRTS